MQSSTKKRLIEFISRTEADARDQRAGRVLKSLLIAGAGAAAGYGLGRMSAGRVRPVSAPAPISTPAAPPPAAPAAVKPKAPKVPKAPKPGPLDAPVAAAKTAAHEASQLRKAGKLGLINRTEVIAAIAKRKSTVDAAAKTAEKLALTDKVGMKDSVAQWSAEASAARGSPIAAVKSSVDNASKVVNRPMRPVVKKKAEAPKQVYFPAKPVAKKPTPAKPAPKKASKPAPKKPAKTPPKKGRTKNMSARIAATIELARWGKDLDTPRERLVARLRNALLAGGAGAGIASVIAHPDRGYKWARAGLAGGAVVGASISPKKRAELNAVYRVVDFASGLVLEKTAPASVALPEVESMRSRLVEMRRIMS
jgi:hypothetical protein